MSLYGGIKFAIGKPGDEVQEGQAGEGSTTQGSNLSSTQNKETTQAPKPAVGKGSAALKFAPRIRQSKPAQPKRSGPTTIYAAEPVFIDTQHPSAGPLSASTSAAQKNVETNEVVIGNDGRPLARAPAMTIAAAQKGKAGDDERKKKKKKKRVGETQRFVTIDRADSVRRGGSSR